jgi:hypothetical protein
MASALPHDIEVELPVLIPGVDLRALRGDEDIQDVERLQWRCAALRPAGGLRDLVRRDPLRPANRLATWAAPSTSTTLKLPAFGLDRDKDMMR